MSSEAAQCWCCDRYCRSRTGHLSCGNNEVRRDRLPTSSVRNQPITEFT
ncbi:DUF3079 domain-containing protein [Vibrio harveyi]